jgi:hypothetical protein
MTDHPFARPQASLRTFFLLYLPQLLKFWKLWVAAFTRQPFKMRLDEKGTAFLLSGVDLLLEAVINTMYVFVLADMTAALYSGAWWVLIVGPLIVIATLRVQFKDYEDALDFAYRQYVASSVVTPTLMTTKEAEEIDTNKYSPEYWKLHTIVYPPGYWVSHTYPAAEQLPPEDSSSSEPKE